MSHESLMDQQNKHMQTFSFSLKVQYNAVQRMIFVLCQAVQG